MPLDRFVATIVIVVQEGVEKQPKSNRNHNKSLSITIFYDDVRYFSYEHARKM